MRTIASIRERIFAPLERAGAQVDVFFHTYTLAKVSSAWAREVDAVVGGPVQELKLLDEGKHRVVEWSATNQQLFDNAAPCPPRTVHMAEKTSALRWGLPRFLSRNFKADRDPSPRRKSSLAFPPSLSPSVKSINTR